MTEEMKKIMADVYFESLHECISEKMDSSISGPTLKLGFDLGYACAMQKVSFFVSRIEELLED